MSILAQRRTDPTEQDSGLRRLSKRIKKAIAREFGLYVTRNPYTLVYQEHLSRLLTTLDINCVLDVGSHHGEFAKQLRDIGYTKRIISFEPVTANYEILERQKANDSEWLCYRMALGAKKGTMPIRVFSGTTFNSFLEPTKYGRDRFPEKMHIERTEPVVIERLDNILDKLIEGIRDPKIFLKVDTQGYDLEVVRGLGTSTRRISALQIEMTLKPLYEDATNSFFESVAYLQGLGFRLSGMFPVDFDLTNGNCPIEMDCVMCRDASQTT